MMDALGNQVTANGFLAVGPEAAVALLRTRLSSVIARLDLDVHEHQSETCFPFSLVKSHFRKIFSL